MLFYSSLESLWGPAAALLIQLLLPGCFCRGFYMKSTGCTQATILQEYVDVFLRLASCPPWAPSSVSTPPGRWQLRDTSERQAPLTQPSCTGTETNITGGVKKRVTCTAMQINVPESTRKRMKAEAICRATFNVSLWNRFMIQFSILLWQGWISQI